MERISTSGVWALFALLVLAAAVVGVGCEDLSCSQSHDAEVLPIVQAIAHPLPARIVGVDAIKVSPTTSGAVIAGSPVSAVTVAEDSALSVGFALRI